MQLTPSQQVMAHKLSEQVIDSQDESFSSNESDSDESLITQIQQIATELNEN